MIAVDRVQVKSKTLAASTHSIFLFFVLNWKNAGDCYTMMNEKAQKIRQCARGTTKRQLKPQTHYPIKCQMKTKLAETCSKLGISNTLSSKTATACSESSNFDSNQLNYANTQRKVCSTLGEEMGWKPASVE